MVSLDRPYALDGTGGFLSPGQHCRSALPLPAVPYGLLHSDLAVVAVIFCQCESVAPAGLGFLVWDQHFLAWLAREGIAVDVCSQIDVDRERAALLGHYRMVLRTGHDEYWTRAEYRATEAYVAGGGNIAFFSGNNCFWQVRFEDDHRRMSSYKTPDGRWEATDRVGRDPIAAQD